MMANTENLSAALAQGVTQGQSKLADVQCTHPPTFSSTADPLDADDWPRNIEAKLVLARCDETEKATYAAYYLHGAAAAWWLSYKTLIPPDECITWAMFKEGFQSVHVPAGLMEIKRREFLALTQGNQTFLEFLNQFNYLSRYATKEMLTEDRKVKLCHEHLNPELKHALSAHEIHSMKTLVDKALRVEESVKEVLKDRKRKWVARRAVSSCSRRPVQHPILRSPSSSPVDFHMAVGDHKEVV
ncbi:hypothetical protein E2562_034757 [Oryza meyeriana var. granulata]|uniref:Retrotransposon gag domain-containing protein n=1 Tax=Oryza meyeriana var. granulata TaxID=110450 RepID=A0A6G1FFH1_9ORYZ|nr:hypothetical protein E2562_034757 [Oryza meyeriana var. granulata]